VELDFTNPETGEPLDKVCFIGRNGTGKSKLLRMIDWFFNSILNHFKSYSIAIPNLGYYDESGKIVFEFQFEKKRYQVLYFKKTVHLLNFHAVSSNERDVFLHKFFFFNEVNDLITDSEFKKYSESTLHEEFVNKLVLHDNSSDLLIYCPPESSNNDYLSISDVPATNVSEAYQLDQNLSYRHLVSAHEIVSFWKTLLFNLIKRRDEREVFENLPESLIKTKQELLSEFNSKSKDILESLDKVWNNILLKAGLEFDFKNAVIPYQLNENLKAYIKLAKTGETIRYNQLSTGIRNYIFRLGHIFSLYFNREIERGFLLVDEPENSLFPDFLFELVETYQEIIRDKRGQNNTQMFFATHSPIIAAQFAPFERIILDWNDDASVKVYKGTAPEGDDPNDILKQDFGLKEIMGTVGLKMWDEYLALKNKLKKAATLEEKMEMAAEFNRIGQLYNFPA
jgi:hypothetical protein